MGFEINICLGDTPQIESIAINIVQNLLCIWPIEYGMHGQLRQLPREACTLKQFTAQLPSRSSSGANARLLQDGYKRCYKWMMAPVTASVKPLFGDSHHFLIMQDWTQR